jgi:predicted DCC family thiol-disulfide oxidoreductase YuxK
MANVGSSIGPAISITEESPQPTCANAAAAPQASPQPPPGRAPELPTGGAPVVFFDGVCGLCNRFVDFVIRHDSGGAFRFAPLQGETAHEHLTEADVRDLKTFVLLDGEGTYRKSTAVLRVLGRLGGFWRAVATVLWLVPRPLRDVGYACVARHRYAIFGKKEACRLPTLAERGRFLP